MCTPGLLQDSDKVRSTIQSQKGKKAATKLEKEDLEAANRVLETLEAGKDLRHVTDWNMKEVDFINRTQFISAKPVVYLVNMSEKDFLRKKNKHLPKVMEYVKANGGDPVIPYSAAFEQRIFDLTEEEKKEVCSLLCSINVRGHAKTTAHKSTLSLVNSIRCALRYSILALASLIP